MPKNWQYACALEGKMLENNQLKIVASSFYTLYDSPFIAAKSIATQEYFVEETQFQIQIIGNYQPNLEIKFYQILKRLADIKYVKWAILTVKKLPNF